MYLINYIGGLHAEVTRKKIGEEERRKYTFSKQYSKSSTRMSTWRVRSFAQKTSSLSGNVYGVSLVVKFSKYVHAATM